MKNTFFNIKRRVKGRFSLGTLLGAATASYYFFRFLEGFFSEEKIPGNKIISDYKTGKN